MLASPLPGIEDLREKREEVNRQILQEEEEKAKIQKDLSILTDRLSKINESLARKVQARNEYDKTIQETEAAYMKVCRNGPTPTLSYHTERPRTERPLYLYFLLPCRTLTLVAPSQILESSQTLLHVLKRETVNLTKKKQSSS